MKLWKLLLFSTALLAIAPGCGEDKFTKEQARQAIQREYSYRKLEYSHAVIDDEKHFPYKDIQLAMEHYDTSKTEDITPLVKVVNQLSKKNHFSINPVLQDLEFKIRQDSLALQAVEEGNYTVKRGHPSGYDVFVRCATTTPDSVTTKVYHYFPAGRRFGESVEVGPFGESDDVGDED
ncbi:MAG: hypothetical protein QE263_02540 [Vampirovibrionales bacterium]|nr:hypothetical protein [Vampirovibrionales bacterium]